MKKTIILTLLTLPLLANNLTIYNNDLALVEENLDFNVTKGINSISYKHLSDGIIYNSIFAKFSNNLHLLSQSYSLKQNIEQLLLKENLNSNIKFYKNRELLSGKLVNISPIIVNSNGLYYTIDRLSELILSKYPKVSKENIKWKIEANKSAKESVKLLYLTKDLSWNANYIIDVKKDKLILNGYAQLKNSSNLKSYNNFKISLLAGDINRQNQNIFYKSVRKKIAFAMSNIEENIKPKSFAGYYNYNLNGIFSIKKGEVKDIPFINRAKVDYKRYGLAYNSIFGNYGKNKLNFTQIIEFNNSLNLPLPKGLARVYKDNKLLGESYIKNTPNRDKVTLNIGTFFDINGEKIITKYINREKYKFVETQYIIKNSSNKEYIVKIKESIPRYGKDIKLNSNCTKECKVKRVSAFENLYTIILKPNSKFDFKSSFEVFK